MLMADSSVQSALPSTTMLKVIIGMLTAIIFIGKYLPHIVFATSVLSLVLAILDFAVWGNLVWGVLNTLFAIGGFYFLAQLLQKHSVSKRETVIEERDMEVPEPAVEVPSIGMAPTNERLFKEQEAA